MNDADYNPNSKDALFSRIMQRLDQQDFTSANHRAEIKTVLTEIQDDIRRAHGRVGKLETWKTELRAKVAIVAVLVSGAVTALWQWWLGRNGHS